MDIIWLWSAGIWFSTANFVSSALCCNEENHPTVTSGNSISCSDLAPSSWQIHAGFLGVVHVTRGDFCHFKSSHGISPRDWNMSNLRTALLWGWVREIIEFGFQDNTQTIYPARSSGEAALCGLDSSRFTPAVSVVFYWQSLNHKCLWAVCGQQAFVF